MAFVSNALGVAGSLLPILALVLLVRGPLSRYFALFLFLLSTTFAWAAQGWVLQNYSTAAAEYRNVYWATELLMDLLLFFLVIWLTTRALDGSSLRRGALRFLGLVLVVVLAVPFLVFSHQVFSPYWNQSTAQLLNFGAAVMNLGLWSALIMNKNRDRQLLTVSAGLGVIVAGAALTLGVRQLTPQDSLLRGVADAVYRLTQTAAPLIWCWAFWPHKKKRVTPPAAPHGEESPTPSIG